jgi:hypothetical protein
MTNTNTTTRHQFPASRSVVEYEVTYPRDEEEVI